MATCTIKNPPAHGVQDAASPEPLLNVYIELHDAPYAYGQVLERGRVVDYAADGTPIGVEFLAVDGCASVASLPNAGLIADALRQHDIPICG